VDEPLDEWLRRDLIEEFGPEKEPVPWAADKVSRIMTRLSAVRAVGGPRLEMCVAAGYDGEHCLQLFDVLESDALDKGDLDGVYGLEDALDPASHGSGAMGWLTEAREWAFERLRGYVPIRERKARLRQPLRR
jgi:hypothetical protein